MKKTRVSDAMNGGSSSNSKDQNVPHLLSPYAFDQGTVTRIDILHDYQGGIDKISVSDILILIRILIQPTQASRWLIF